MYNFLRIKSDDVGFSVADTLEFFLNRAELSLNPVNSGNLKITEALCRNFSNFFLKQQDQ